MRIAAFDLSTKAIDVVTVPLDPGPPSWSHYQLDGASSLERCRQIRHVLPGPTSEAWDEVVLAVIEDPKGYGSTSALHRVVGGIIQTVPASVDLWLLGPKEWRRELGLWNGNDSKRLKDEAVLYSMSELDKFGIGWIARRALGWTGDAHDAHCIALAARKMLERGREIAA